MEARPAVEEALARAVPEGTPAGAALPRAMFEAALSPGKRLRPLVALAAGSVARAPRRAVMPVAVAVELVHAASLVLDDLPSMDDARRRRGRPALHVTYGVSTAELASVALLSRAFETLASAPEVPAGGRARLVSELSKAVGADGCCGGQAADLSADPARLTLEELESIHARKTGALFVAAVRGGAIAGGAPDSDLDLLTVFARNLGLAFQITDDLLDLEGSPEIMGKDTLRDGHRANFATLFGADAARSLVDELLDAAVSALSSFRSRAAVLADLARVVRDRRS
ncbi:MAG: polyprenyl synthetase family protein [Acidobacteria bacterium]|nr:polyprenyl synthetase family protein [Acidobacteriota bacterium]MCA1611569.1 polyprenyl synthetase family protein [Acidobacteriota bacterium]